jgi:hypothetical protein
MSSVSTVAVAAAVGLLVIATFQVALALGAPLGRAAWGGTRTHLPTSLRIASGVAAVFWCLAAVVVLARGGLDAAPLPAVIARWGTWVLVALLPVGALMNVASTSPWERFLWAPLALVLAILCLVVARS